MDTNSRNMKYGMFIHYVESLTCRRDGTMPVFGQAAEEFDVEGFAESLTSFGVEYIIFTAWHFNMVCLYPAAKVDAWLPNHCVKRDLLRDIIVALKPRGIKVIFYTHPRDGHDFSEEDAIITGWGAGNKGFAPNPNPDTYNFEKWNNFINDAYAELMDRYGNDIAGLYLDEGSAAGDSYKVVDYPRLRQTIKSRNPKLVMIQNYYGNLYSCDIGDKEYCHWGEFASADGDTWPAYTMPVGTVMSHSWMADIPEGQNTVMFTAEALFRYTVLQAGANTDGYGVQWAAGPYAGGGWENGVYQTMAALGKYVNAVAPSIKRTIPSTSYVTLPGATIHSLDWGVATTSEDGATEYLHVLKPPSSNILTLPAPADGKQFSAAIVLTTGRAVSMNQTEDALILNLDSSDGWNEMDTVIMLTSC